MAGDAEKFIVYHSRWKMGVLAAFLAALAVLAAIAPVVLTLRHARDLWAAYVLCFGGVLFFGYGALKSLYVIKHSVPAVVLSSQGVDERSYLLGSAGFIPWSEIESFRFFRSGIYAMIAVFLHDEKAFLRRQSPVKRFFTVTGKAGRQGAPVVISMMTLSISTSELLERMVTYHRPVQRHD